MPNKTLDERAMSVRCTLCNARPYEPCISTATIRVVNKVPHVARIDDYIRLQEKQKNDKAE